MAPISNCQSLHRYWQTKKRGFRRLPECGHAVAYRRDRPSGCIHERLKKMQPIWIVRRLTRRGVVVGELVGEARFRAGRLWKRKTQMAVRLVCYTVCNSKVTIDNFYVGIAVIMLASLFDVDEIDGGSSNLVSIFSSR
jgi:hypothetical protein